MANQMLSSESPEQLAIDELDDSGKQKQESDDQESSETAPLLFVDVNLGPNDQRRIVVYEGDSASELARQFCIENELDEDTFEKLE